MGVLARADELSLGTSSTRSYVRFPPIADTRYCPGVPNKTGT